MSRYVLDSTVLIEYAAGVEPTTTRVVGLVEAKAELFVSAVQLTEFYSGAAFGTNPTLDAFLSRLKFVPLTREISLTAGNYRFAAQMKSRRLATPDALVAAMAHHLSATLLTNDVRDFWMEGLTVERLGGKA